VKIFSIRIEKLSRTFYLKFINCIKGLKRKSIDSISGEVQKGFIEAAIVRGASTWPVSRAWHKFRIHSKRISNLMRGRIMNVASTAAFLPGPLMAVYFATKAYVLSFSNDRVAGHACRRTNVFKKEKEIGYRCSDADIAIYQSKDAVNRAAAI
jgi:hypothetical protein